jgi:phage tail sheath protein FI
MSEVTPIYGDGILNAAVVAAATRAWLDKTVGWHKSISNVVLTGPTGISQVITFDMEDPDTDAGYLNQNQVTTMIQHNGIRFWGNRTTSADPRFAFEVSVRTAQVIKDSIIEACFPFIDQPLTPYLAKDIIDSINAFLRRLSSGKERRLMGGSVWYDASLNPTESLMNGILCIDYDYTPIPPLENLVLNQRQTGRFMVDFGKLITGGGLEDQPAAA